MGAYGLLAVIGVLPEVAVDVVLSAEAGRVFAETGGEVVGSVRMPVANPDFSAFVQRAKDLNPEAIFIFIPGGAQPIAITKAFQERGFPADKILGQGEITMDDNALKSMGDAAVGIRTVFHYGWEHNAGYATFVHRRGIEEHGITPFHRRSFARVRAIAIGEQLELDLPPENLDALLVPELAAVSEG